MAAINKIRITICGAKISKSVTESIPIAAVKERGRLTKYGTASNTFIQNPLIATIARSIVTPRKYAPTVKGFRCSKI